MLVLSIDTSGPDCAAALLRAEDGAGAIVARRSERVGRGHAERLMPMIESVLAEGGAGFAALDRIAVTTGPGSFTGVRIGIAAARGLALALAIEAVGIGSLEALSLPAARARKEGIVVAVLDARRGEVFARAADLASGRERIAATAIGPDALAATLAGMPTPLVLTGAGVPLVHALLPQAEIAGTEPAPDIADVAWLALAREAALPPAPLYVRGADAKPQAAMAMLRQ
jgi:tRNA threonylcarbamoyladenosine biosynthesis protein TsaB